MGKVIHFGFATYLLMFVLFLIALAFVAPEAFEAVIEAIRQIARALMGA